MFSVQRLGQENPKSFWVSFRIFDFSLVTVRYHPADKYNTLSWGLSFPGLSIWSHDCFGFGLDVRAGVADFYVQAYLPYLHVCVGWRGYSDFLTRRPKPESTS